MLKRLIHYSEEIRLAFSKQKLGRLRELAHELTKNAARHNDKLMAHLAIIAYSLHKLESKIHIRKSESWQEIKLEVLTCLKEGMTALNENDFKLFEKNLDLITKKITQVDSKIGRYATKLEDKARAKVASTAYGLGLSLNKSIELTNAEKRDVLNYIGTTKMHDEAGVTLNISQRINTIKEKLLGEK